MFILFILILVANVLFFWDALKKSELREGLTFKMPAPWSWLGKRMSKNGFLLVCFLALMALNGIAGILYYLWNILGATIFYCLMTAGTLFLLSKDIEPKPKMPS